MSEVRTGGTSELAAEVESAGRESFGFLTELGFHAEQVRVHLPEVWVSLSGDVTEVTIIYGAGSTPWVELARRGTSQGTVVKAETSSLELLLEERAPSASMPQCEIAQPGSEAFRACLRAKAAALREFGSDILGSNFEVFPRLRIRAAENERKRNLELIGSTNGETTRN